MTPLVRNSLGAAVLVALASGGLYLAQPDALPPPAPTEQQVGLSLLACLPDAGKACVALYDVGDGGQEYRLLPVCDCARQPADGGDCKALRQQMDGGLEPVDLGPLTRFPADASVGAGCELVACSIIAGQDPDGDECSVLPDGGIE